MADIAWLEPRIYAILTAPAVDLNSISAKRVRAQLRADDPDLEEEWVREHKEEIDKLTAAVFDRVRAEGTTKAKPSRKKSAEEDADAEYAKRLASELNAHQTRAGSTGATGKKKTAANGKRKAKKSAEEIEDSGDDDAVAPKKAKKRKTKKDDNDDGTTKKRGGGFQKEYALSPAMSQFTGTEALSRPQIVKRIWDHIKANNLQNPGDKREILCDDAMQNVFGVTRMNMFQMNKLISNHVFEPQEST